MRTSQDFNKYLTGAVVGFVYLLVILAIAAAINLAPAGHHRNVVIDLEALLALVVGYVVIATLAMFATSRIQRSQIRRRAS